MLTNRAEFSLKFPLFRGKVSLTLFVNGKIMPSLKVVPNGACDRCLDRPGTKFETPITMAFQPIFDIRTGDVFAQEALLRGLNGEGAGDILAQVDERTMYSFDQKCRVRAIERAVEEQVNSFLSINFLPNAVYEPANCIRTTLWAAEKYGFPTQRIIFEFIETEEIKNFDHIKGILEEYRKHGFQTALDDFGAGYANLEYLRNLRPDILKLDRKLCSGIDTDSAQCDAIAGLVEMCRVMGVLLVAEGIETPEELATLKELGVEFAQGYLLARPRLPGLATDCSHAMR